MQNVPSAAAQVIVTIIPIVGIVMGCVVIFFYLLYNHKQKMLMIEKGLIKKHNFDIQLFSIFAGLMLFGIGLALTIFFVLKEGINYSMISGLVPFSCGISLILFYYIYKKESASRKAGS